MSPKPKLATPRALEERYGPEREQYQVVVLNAKGETVFHVVAGRFDQCAAIHDPLFLAADPGERIVCAVLVSAAAGVRAVIDGEIEAKTPVAPSGKGAAN